MSYFDNFGSEARWPLTGTCEAIGISDNLIGQEPHPVQKGCVNWKPLEPATEAAASKPPTTSKDTNPKDAIGVTKLPLSLVPQSAIALASLAHLNGALKYGKFNWRAAGVRASVYLDAARRHLAKWENGEEIDEESVPHLASAMACLNILVDARACGKLNDDRPPSFDVSKFFDELTPTVKKLQGLHAGKTPRHYTIDDTEKK